ncbi:MAG: hypothetical protein N3B13_03295, partial [Deltaproteobacteria bacterium]|nr:hypothetical protein [Deltaproteobacteria bacterium]
MKKIITLILILSINTASAENTDNELKKRTEINIELLNMFILRNDTDFDRTDPFYSKYGQEMGLAGTFFKPMLKLNASESVKFYWEAEIGLDLWSRNNPDIGLDEKNASYAIGLKQREIYGEVNTENFLLKAGFQRVMDISTLFINHWIGALKLGYQDEEFGVFLLGGEYPDQTHKGWDFSSSNFMTDVFVIGTDGFYKFLESFKLRAGIYFIDDLHIIERRRQITAVESGVGYTGDDLDVSAAIVYLHGYRQRGGADLKNINISAYGVAAS